MAISGENILYSGAIVSSPRVACSASGDCTIVWRRTLPSGLGSSIAVRRRVDGRWTEEESLASPNRATQARQPVVRLDSSANPHVVWVGEKDGSTFLEYAFLVDLGRPVWSYFPSLASSRNTIEFPTLALGPRDQTFVAWQEREGSLSRIHAFVVDDAGETHHAVLDGQDKAHEVVYPDLVSIPPTVAGGEPRMAVYWLNLDGLEPRIEMRRWDPETRDWTPFAPPQWPKEVVETLPYILSSPETEPFLVGHRPVGRYDRVFLCSGEGDVTYLDPAAEAWNRFPVASLELDERRGMVWEQESNGATTLIQAVVKPKALLAGAGSAIVTRPLAVADSYLVPEPDVAISGRSLLSVWIGWNRPQTPLEEPSGSGGTPAVFFSETDLASFELERLPE
ncbi:hypothetical protein JW916_16445 [Candidatus Sumerlaeota bacterium]|nr:hypothetical protein [Candidatus Sumerlaeota bacterium]